MRYLNSTELTQLHDSIATMLMNKGNNESIRIWGFPSNNIKCSTYTFETESGAIYIGHHDFVHEKKWWLPIASGESLYGEQLQISFEMCVPKNDNKLVSIHYVIDNDEIVHILHKGKFTVGHGSLSMKDFFTYYKNNPGKWEVINFSNYNYIELGKTNIYLTENQFSDLLNSLASFADYLSAFKNRYRLQKAY